MKNRKREICTSGSVKLTYRINPAVRPEAA